MRGGINMKKKKPVFALALVLVCAAGGADYYMYGYSPKKDSETSADAAVCNAANTAAATDSEGNPAGESEPPESVSDETAGQGAGSDTDGNGAAPPLLIEIEEDRIIYDGKEVSLSELEDILREYENTEYVWELRDTRQAVKRVYDEAAQLLDKYNIPFNL
jgi:hypothetical protein